MAKRAFITVRDIIFYAGYVVVLGKVTKGCLETGMVTNIGPKEAIVDRIEASGTLSDCAKEGKKVNIWLKGPINKGEVEREVYSMEFKGDRKTEQ